MHDLANEKIVEVGSNILCGRYNEDTDHEPVLKISSVSLSLIALKPR
jgi:hypothetical protein